jgi:hypothetical protein
MQHVIIACIRSLLGAGHGLEPMQFAVEMLHFAAKQRGNALAGRS